MYITYITCLVLIGLSGFMLDWHRRSWRAAEHDATLSDRERRFLRAQFRRRMQASGIIGLLGAAIGIKPLVPQRPWPMVLYVLFLASACACIMVLAGLDAWATRQHYARIRSEQLTAQLKLARDLSAARKSADSDS
jgi:hypothetical protein